MAPISSARGLPGVPGDAGRCPVPRPVPRLGASRARREAAGATLCRDDSRSATDMTTDRSRAYARVTRTVEDLGPSKLHDLERRRIRNAADALVFAGVYDAAAL